MTRIAIPAAIVLIVVASIVGLTGWNRSAEPRQVIELTERELSLPFGSEDGLRDGAPLKLNLQIEYRGDALDARNWLSEERLRGNHPAERMQPLAEMYAATKAPIDSKRRTDGLSFRATDGTWSIGEGPEVAGPGIDLVRAISGRVDAYDTLEGPGVATLKYALSHHDSRYSTNCGCSTSRISTSPKPASRA